MSRYGYASPVWMIELNMSVAYPVNDKSIMLGQNYQDFIRIVICNHVILKLLLPSSSFSVPLRISGSDIL